MEIDKKLYYSYYTIAGDNIRRTYSNIVKVQFNNWKEGCKRPKYAILKKFHCIKKVFKDEAKTLRMVSKLHKNIVKYYHEQEIEEEKVNGKKVKKYCLFMELCEHESVANQMQMVEWDIAKKLRICSEIVDALSVLHSHFLAHRNINLDHIFLTAEDEVRIGSFNFAKNIRLGNVRHSIGGPPDYMSPFLNSLHKSNIGSDERINPFKEDVWSTGKTLYEIITYGDMDSLLREYTYNSATELEEEKIVKAKAQREMLNCGLQVEAIEIILDMLTFDADSRISMGEANFRFKNLPLNNSDT